MIKQNPTYAARHQPAKTIDGGRAIITGVAGNAPTTGEPELTNRRVEACLDRHAGLRPDVPDTSDTLKKAKRITKPQTNPELGI